MRSRGSNVTRSGPVATNSESSASLSEKESIAISFRIDPVIVPTYTVPRFPTAPRSCAVTRRRMRSRPKSVRVVISTALATTSAIARITLPLTSATRRRRVIG